MQEYAAVRDRRAPFGRYRLEVCEAVFVPLLLDKPIEATIAVSQFRLHTLEGACQLFTLAGVNMRGPLSFR